MNKKSRLSRSKVTLPPRDVKKKSLTSPKSREKHLLSLLTQVLLNAVYSYGAACPPPMGTAEVVVDYLCFSWPLG